MKDTVVKMPTDAGGGIIAIPFNMPRASGARSNRETERYASRIQGRDYDDCERTYRHVLPRLRERIAENSLIFPAIVALTSRLVSY